MNTNLSHFSQHAGPDESLIHEVTYLSQNEGKTIKVGILKLANGDFLRIEEEYDKTGELTNCQKMFLNYVLIHAWNKLGADPIEIATRVQEINNVCDQFNLLNPEKNIHLKTKKYSETFVATELYFQPCYSTDSLEFPPAWVQTVLENLKKAIPKFSWSRDFRLG